MHRILVALQLVTSLVGIPDRATAESDRPLLPDLSFYFDCDPKMQRTNVESVVTEVLRELEFRTLNIGRLQRDNGVILYNSYIIAIDKNDRMVNVRSFLPNLDSYSVTLYSAPPTQRSLELEATLLSFAEKALDCSVRQIARNQNDSSVGSVFNMEVNRIESLFREAKDLRFGPRI
jgi:hypothetical protein